MIASELFAKTKLKPKDIDGVGFTVPLSECSNPFWSNYCTDYLGITTRWLQTTDLGGGSAIGNMARASMALQADLCETVMLIGADAPSTKWSAVYGAYRNELWEPTGINGPPGAFGLLYQRYAAQYDLDFRGLGALAAAQRNGAAINENAYEKFRKRITIDDYLNSRMIADPIRLLDSVMVCDGASGVLVTGRKTAEKRGLTRIAVPVGYGERTNYRAGEAIVDVTESGHYVAGQRAFSQAGLAPKDVAAFHPYDDFIIAIMLQLEMLGFCKRGQGCQFIREHDFTHTGDLPLNTGGGQISAGQCGLAGGGTNVVEAVRQLFGDGGKRQVKNTGNALVTGIGGIPYGRNWSSSVVMILTPNA